MNRAIGLLSVLFLLSSSIEAQRTRVVPSSPSGDSPQEARPTPRSRPAQRSAGGTRITRDPALVPPRHTSIIQNQTLVDTIRRQRAVEIVPNRNYWHQIGKRRYTHYFDGSLHWYGFRNAGRFYWTALYGDRWWWFDPYYDRWLFWHSGLWWWPAPTGVMYVYVNDDYRPHDQAGLDLPEPDLSTAPSGGSWKSPDGRRMVQVHGPKLEAFLYDVSSGSPRFMKSIDKGIEKVRFSGGTGGKPLRILLDRTDGSFALLAENGEPIPE